MEIASIEMWQARIYNELMIPLAMGFRHCIQQCQH